MKITASGFIVFRNNNNYPEVLGLKALPKHRRQSKGIYDVPKGRIDPGETAIQAAHRECLEEAGLIVKRVIHKTPLINGPLALWVAEVELTDEVIVIPNPETGELEHEGFKWMSIDDLKNNCLSYLRPMIHESKKIIWERMRLF